MSSASRRIPSFVSVSITLTGGDLAFHGEFGKGLDPFHPFCERAAVALLFPEPFFEALDNRVLF